MPKACPYVMALSFLTHSYKRYSRNRWCVKKSPAIWGGRADIWGNKGDLFQNHVDEGGHIAYVHYAIAVDVANCVGIVGEGENFVD